MCVPIGEGSLAPIFFVSPEHHPHRSAGPQSQMLHETNRLPGRDRAAAVVHGSLANIPGVDVTAEHYHLVRPLASDHLGHDIAGGSVGQGTSSHSKGDHDRLATVLKALEHHGILHAQSRSWDARSR